LVIFAAHFDYRTVESEAGHKRNGQTEIHFNNYESAGVCHIELSQSPAKRPNSKAVSSDAGMSLTRAFPSSPIS
jgi:hypothetical protein